MKEKTDRLAKAMKEKFNEWSTPMDALDKEALEIVEKASHESLQTPGNP